MSDTKFNHMLGKTQHISHKDSWMPPGFELGQVRGGLQVILTAEHYIHLATGAVPQKSGKIL